MGKFTNMAQWYLAAEKRFFCNEPKHMSCDAIGRGYLASLEAQELAWDIGGRRENLTVIASVKSNRFEIGVALMDVAHMKFQYNLWHRAPGENWASPVCILEDRDELIRTIDDILRKAEFTASIKAKLEQTAPVAVPPSLQRNRKVLIFTNEQDDV
jgi:hypothetical protein